MKIRDESGGFQDICRILAVVKPGGKLPEIFIHCSRHQAPGLFNIPRQPLPGSVHPALLSFKIFPGRRIARKDFRRALEGAGLIDGDADADVLKELAPIEICS